MDGLVAEEDDIALIGRDGGRVELVGVVLVGGQVRGGLRAQDVLQGAEQVAAGNHAQGAAFKGRIVEVEEAVDEIGSVVRVEGIVLVHGERRAFFRWFGVQHGVVPLHIGPHQLLDAGDQTGVEDDPAPGRRIVVRVVEEYRLGVEALVLGQVAVAPGAVPADGLLAPLIDNADHFGGQFAAFGPAEKAFDFDIAVALIVVYLSWGEHADLHRKMVKNDAVAELGCKRSYRPAKYHFPAALVNRVFLTGVGWVCTFRPWSPPPFSGGGPRGKEGNMLERIALVLIAALGLAACGGGGEAPPEDRALKVGYVVNYMSHEWYQNICQAAQERARELGVDLVIADANQNVGDQISKAENFMVQGVDVLVLTPVDAKALGPIVQQAKEAGIQVITEANPVPGSATYVGIDNEAAGRKAGEWFAEKVRRTGMDARILVIGLPNFEDCRQRVDGFKAAMENSGVDYEIVQEVDGQGLKEKAFKVSQDALTAHPEINVIYGINDDSTTGGMAAFKAAGLDESQLTAIGFGFEGAVGRSALLGDTPYEAALAMFPNFVGVSLVDAAVALGQGRTLPEHYATPTIVVTRENFATYYSKRGEDYAMNFAAIRKLMP